MERRKTRWTCLLLLVVAHSLVVSAKVQLKLGFLYPYEGGNQLVTELPFGSAFFMAVERIKNESSKFPGFELSSTWNDTFYNELVALDSQSDQWKNGVHAYIGPGNDSTCAFSARLAAAYNKPLIAYYCSEKQISDKKSYPTTARTIPPNTQVTQPLLVLLRHYNWTVVSIISSYQADWSTLAKDVTSVLKNSGIRVAYEGKMMYGHGFEKGYEEATNTELENIKNNSRVVILLGDVRIMREFVLRAHRKGMANENYVYIMVVHKYDYMKMKRGCNYWYTGYFGPKNDAEALEAYQSVLILVRRPYNETSYKSFESEVAARMTMEPFNRSVKAATTVSAAAYLYDAVYLYALAVNKTIGKGKDPTNGLHVFENIKQTSFQSITGYTVHVDDQGDTEMNMTLLDLQPSNNSEVKDCGYVEMLQIAEFRSAEDQSGQTLAFSKPIIWSKSGTSGPPLAVPKCGFMGELCVEEKEKEDDSQTTIMLITGFTVATVTIVSMTLFISFYRRRKYERELESKLWKINFAEISLNNMMTGFSRISIGSDKDLNTSGGRMQIFTQVGHYRGNVVAIKMLNVQNVDERTALLLEFKQMRDVRHDNLNSFIGACIEPPNVCIVTSYCNKGSLEDVLHNENIKLDNIFINSMVSDISKGMEYLHDSDIKSHGNLKSANCIVDTRWVVKITDFGLPSLRGLDKKDLTEDAYYSHLLWKAPELLRMKNPPTRGTQKGDVFSFAIILHEISTRNYPYSSYYLENKEIVLRVLAGEDPPYRPEVPVNSTHRELDALMESCWAENPENRPVFSDIRKTIRKITGGKSVNLLDKMVYMLEEYSMNLEQIVEKRTEQWMEEKKKTEELLHSMLPKSVADQLKQGKPVQAESFSEVSIFFSDIVGFTALSSESTPLQVIDLLNDLYTLFDDITSNYDVYKVETIGDAYMVVSGLPVRNGHLHAREIANMALHLLSAVHKFKIRHRPGMQLKLRIGLHSGPACSGVVGLKMPRYCLFGDTVNMASRMESNGEALKIHISGSTKSILENLHAGYIIEERGLVFLKGKGDITTYWLLGKKEEESVVPPPRLPPIPKSRISNGSPLSLTPLTNVQVN